MIFMKCFSKVKSQILDSYIISLKYFTFVTKFFDLNFDIEFAWLHSERFRKLKKNSEKIFH